MRVGVRGENPAEAIALRAGLAPEPLFDAYFALMGARVLMAGHSLGILAALGERADTAEGVAARLGLDARGTDALLVALHALRYVEAHGERYAPSARTRRTLLPGARMDLRRWMDFTGDMWDMFGELEQRVRSGEAQDIHDSWAPGDPVWERYMRGLFELSQLSAPDVARAIGARSPERMLDLAGGHGGFAMALCDRHPGLRATIADLPASVEVSRPIVEEAGYSGRIDFLGGDFFATELGTGYDLATAFSIVHHFDAERNVELLRRARAALRPGGRMAVFELERPRPGRRGSQVGTLTGVLFYLSSRARTYTAEEIAGFLRAAGFERVRTKRLLRAPGSVLVLGDA